MVLRKKTTKKREKVERKKITFGKIIKVCFTTLLIGLFVVTASLSIIKEIRKDNPNFLVDYHNLRGKELYDYMANYHGKRNMDIENYFNKIIYLTPWNEDTIYFDLKANAVYYYNIGYYNSAISTFQRAWEYCSYDDQEDERFDEHYELSMFIASSAYHAGDIQTLNLYGFEEEEIKSIDEVDPRAVFFFYDNVFENLELFKKNIEEYGCKYGDYDGTIEGLEALK